MVLLFVDPVNGSSVCRTMRRSAVGRSIVGDRAVRSARNRDLALRIMPACDTLPIHQLLPILLFEEVHLTGGSLQPVPTLTPRSASPTHRSSVAQSPRHTTSYAGRAPPLPLWRWRVVQSQLLSYDWDLGMISRPPHPMTPDDLVILKQEFSTDLFEVAAGQHIPARLQALGDAAHDNGDERALLIFWRLAQIPGAGQAEEAI